MSKDKKDFYNIAELTAKFEEQILGANVEPRTYYTVAAFLASAQQSAVLSGRVAELQAQFDGIGKSLRSIAVSLDKIVNSVSPEVPGDGKTKS